MSWKQWEVHIRIYAGPRRTTCCKVSWEQAFVSWKVEAKKARNIWNKENTEHKLEVESKMKIKTICSFGFKMVLGFYALKLCPQNQTQKLITENKD